MKKEILIAILIGLSLGLTITYGFYRVRLNMLKRPSTETLLQASPSASPNTPSVIAIHNPEAGTIQTETALTYTGTTVPNSYVVLFVGDEDFITTADDSGNFTFDIELNQGANVLTLHVIEEDSTVSTDERVVIVSDIFESDPTNTATDSATTQETEE